MMCKEGESLSFKNIDKVDIKIRSKAEIVDSLLSLTTVFFIINLIGFLIKYIPIIFFKYLSLLT